MFEVSTHFESAAHAMAHLNALTEIRKSTACKTTLAQKIVQKIIPSLAEKGLFAKQDIPAGAVIGEYIGQPVTKDDVRQKLLDERYVVWEALPNGEFENGRYSKSGLALANHSRDQFNMTMRDDYVCVTSRDIKSGEELTWRYGNFDYAGEQSSPKEQPTQIPGLLPRPVI